MPRLKAFDEDRAVDAAVDCFWARGYGATSVRDLAEAMGIGGASLYNAYGDKRALFERALERYANRSMRERISRIEARHAPRQAIGAFLAEIVDRSVRDPDCRGCLLVNSALDAAHGDAELAKLVASYLGEIRAFFRRSLRACRRDGAVAPNLDFAHVAYVKESRAAAHGSVLFDHALVLYRHIPAGKLDHFCARPAVRRKQRGSF